MTRAEDVQLAVALRVDFIGLIFAERSLRRLDIAQATALRALIPATTRAVALMMDNRREDVEAVIAGVRPDVLQFHGGEDDAFCTSFGVPFFKAIAMGDGGDPGAAMAAFPSAQGFVLDGHGAGEAGGSGRSFDWTQLPRSEARPILLAGGLTADNVALAIRTAQPWGVDVSSGIEARPGIKDADALRRFVASVRAAG